MASTEEQSMDVSWMTHGKDKLSRHNSNKGQAGDREPPEGQPTQPLDIGTAKKPNGHTNGAATSSPPPSPGFSTTPPAKAASAPTTATTAAKPIPPRPGIQTRGSHDEKKSPGTNGTSPGRRGSWFSKILPSSAQQATTSPAEKQGADDDDDLTPLPKLSQNKNAVLPHATKPSGEGPYVPAPPRNSQSGLLHMFSRRFSNNSPVPAPGKNNHGLVERRVLNVDKNRERPRLDELNQAKLRRVAFCVDVEIAPLPKYTDEAGSCNKPAEKNQKRKVTEKSEGEALKRPEAVEEQKEKQGVVAATGESLPREPATEGTTAAPNGQAKEPAKEPTKEPAKEPAKEDGAKPAPEPKPEKETTRKKEKKKKSEAERKAKKEQKRKEALEKGCIPMEIYLSDSSTEDLTLQKVPTKPQSAPTTNPGRIYRRCCQLRETDILTKVTLQLPKSVDSSGMVEKLDLTGYFMSLQDLVTLGDFLAVVPVKEVILENCGLTDEGVRVVLAGLLAARKPNARSRRSVTKPADLTQQGGVVERLILKNNKLGMEGWKHVCLFIHMCRSIKCLDLSSIPFPARAEPAKSPLSNAAKPKGPCAAAPVDLAALLSKAVGDRLAGDELELLNMGETGLTTDQLGALVDGVLKSGVSRLGLAHNDLDSQGVQHVARYLRGGKCQGLDLGGNDLRDDLDIIADAINEDDTLWALSLANCNLKPSSLCKLLPKLALLKNFKFVDLSHNQELCESEPSAIGMLRRYLPKMDSLKRLHLADVAMTPEQAIALAEILPEVKDLAHINLLENPKLVMLADAKTEDGQEEACALYASLLAAARVSDTLVKIDIDNPSAESGEIVKALANQVVAYCLHNVRLVPDIGDNAASEPILPSTRYPDVLRHIVGHEDDSLQMDGIDDGNDAPDEDYVIGGTGVVKALACVLKNVGDDSSRQSGEFMREVENGAVGPRPHVPSGKAKDMSKHLLASARKIHVRLTPALARAKAASHKDMNNYSRLVFLNHTIEGIIQRFEDEFPDTRIDAQATAPEQVKVPAPDNSASVSSGDVEAVFASDNEDLETELKSPMRSRSNSIISSTSKALAEEEGRALRVGHKFRRGFLRPAHYDLLTSSAANEAEQTLLIQNVLDDLGPAGEDLRRKAAEQGAIAMFHEDKDEVFRRLRDLDPVYWDRFIEAQEKARANVQVADAAKEAAPCPFAGGGGSALADESAIADDSSAIVDESPTGPESVAATNGTSTDTESVAAAAAAS